MFGVYHPKKPKQIRVVFDSSAKYNGVSLNDELLTGPDLNNPLIGLLIRFRKKTNAFTADIEQMFDCFLVKEDDRNFLRFLWFLDNDETSPSAAVRRELCVFSDASTKAIAAVAYIKVTDVAGNCHIGFVMGKAKLAPRPEHTVPRLELRAAVLAVELADLISGELDLQIDGITYYFDSKVILGNICSETRRFYVHVNNHVLRIRRSSHPDQWHYVPTEQNPADQCNTFFDGKSFERHKLVKWTQISVCAPAKHLWEQLWACWSKLRPRHQAFSVHFKHYIII